MTETIFTSSRIAVGFATSGRADVLAAAVRQVSRQTFQPAVLVISHIKPEDVDGVRSVWAPKQNLTVLQSPAGLPRQRNAILDVLGDDIDVVLFLDDDFLMSPHYLETLSAVMSGNPDIVAATGTPLADDARGPGLSVAQGMALIDGSTAGCDHGFDPAPHGYGCNMAIRLSTARAHDLRFDERLPLYAWSEDIDFTHRIGRFGRIVKLRGARGVHLGVKHGRSSGRRLGYSQVANPIYLRSKGSYSWRRALGSVGRNIAANGVRSFWPEHWIDRRGRLLGNALAFIDLLRGRLRPERILDL